MKNSRAIPDSPKSPGLGFALTIGFLLSASAIVSAGGYTDTHDDGSLTGWTAHGVTSTMRTWSESGGLVLPQENTNNAGFLINDYATAVNGTFNFTLKFVDAYNGRYGGGVFRYIDSTRFYFVRVEVGNNSGTDAGNKVVMCTNAIASTGCTTVASNLNFSSTGNSYPIRVVTSGSTFNFYLSGTYIGQVTDGTNGSGKVGYAYSTQYQGSSYLQFDRSDWTDSASASATKYTWTGNSSTDWGTSTNWSPNGVPGASDTIVVDKSGGATIALNGDRSIRIITLGNSSSNAMTIQQGSSGTLTIASGGAVSSVSGSTGSHVISSPVALSSTLTTTVSNASGSIEYSGVVSGSHGITKAGSGTMKLSGANTYTGSTTASAGTIKMGNTAGLGATGTGTTIQSGATLDLNGIGVGGEPIAIAGTGVGGTGAIVNSGAEIQYGLRFLTLNADASIGGSNRFDLRWVSGGGGEYFNANNYTLTKLGSSHITFQAVAIQNFNGIVVSAGTFGAEENATFPSGGSGFTVQSGATLFLWRSTGSTAPVSMNNATLVANNGTMSWAGNFTLTGSNTFQVDGTSLTLSGVIGGAGSLTKTGANPLTLTAANTYTGATTISTGTLKLGVANALPSGSDVTVNGTLDMNGYSDVIGSLAGSGTVDNTSGTGTYTLTSGGNNTSTTFSGIVQNTSGAVALTKTGSGTLTLTGNNTFSGGYTHYWGNTTLGHSNALGTGAVTMSGTGQLSLNNGINIGNTVTISACNAGIGNGAINSVSGANATWSGTINVNSDCVNGGQLSGAADQTGSLTIAGPLNMGGTATWVQQRDGLVIYSGGGNATRFDLLKGTARLGATNGLPTGALFSQTHTGYASTLDLYGYSQTFMGLYSPTNALTSITNSQAGLGTLTLNGSTDTTYLGAITGNLALVKSGAYRQSLGGSNTFTGATTISAGTLQLASATGVSSSSAMTVNGTLDLNGFNGTVASLAGSGTVDNTSSTAGTYTLTTGGNNSSTTFSGVIRNTAQTVAFTKVGSGTQTLSGNNTFTGATTVNAGTLVLSGQSASATNTIASGAVLELNYGSNTVLTGSKTFSGAGTLRKTGGGSVEWGAAAATFALSSGALIDVQAGTLKGGSSSNEVWTNNYSDLNVASGASFHGVEASVRVDALTGAGTIQSGYSSGYTGFTFGVDNGSGDFTGVLANQDGTYAANFTKVGTGTQTLSGANTYSGTTTIGAGTLKLNNTSALGTTAGATSVASGAVLDLNGVNYASAEPLTLNGSGISSGGALTNASASAATFGGLVTLGSDARISTNSGSIAMSNAGTISGSGYTLTLAGSGSGTLASVIGVGAGGLVKNGTGTWTISGASTYSGTTSILQGTLKTGAASAIPSGSAVTVTGTLDLNGYDQTVGSLAGAGTVDNTSASAGTWTLTTGGDNSSTTFSGVVKNTAQTVALTKSGSGTLALTGINTFSGATTVNTGTLLVNGTNANSAVTVNSGATLGGTGTVGTVNVPSGGILAPGSSGAGTLNTGALTMASGSVLNADLDATSDKIVTTGNLSLAGTVNVTAGGGFGPGTYTLFTFSNSLTSNTLAVGTIPAGYSGQIVQNGNDVNLVLTKSLTVTGSFTANNKTYDGTTSATIAVNSLSLSGIVGADAVTLSPTLVFSSASAGTGKTVSLTGSTLSGVDAAKYTLSLSGAPTTTASITAKTLTVTGSFTANDKAYDKTTAATINNNSLSLTGIVGADVVTLSPTLVFSDAAVGSNKTVSLTGSTIGGAAASNYALSLAGAPTTTASITAKSLTITGSFTAGNKTYDGTTSATINGNSLSLSGVVGGDAVTLSPTLVFASAAAGAGKTVSLTGSTLGGANASSYSLSLSGAPTTTASITAKTLTVAGSFTANDKQYDNTTAATINTNSLTLTGIVGADAVTLVPNLVFADATIGAGKTVSLTGSTLGGGAASNYALSLAGAPTTTASITTKTLTITGSFTAGNKTYDGTTSSTISGNSLSLSGVVGADVVTLTPTLVFASSAVGAGKTVSLTGSTLGGADAAKYTLSLSGAPTTTASITAKTLTVGGSFTANDKQYDNTTAATINNNSLSLTGVVGADAVTLTPTLVFSDAAIGAGKTVSLTGSTIGGAAASNYALSLAGAPTTTASITAKSLTITGSFTAGNKTYDGTTSATIAVNSLSLSGIVGADVVTLSPTLVFSSAAVGAGKTVSLTGSTLGGADAAKYTLSLSGAPTTTASITQKTLTVGGSFTANDKAFDNTTAATINTNSLSLTGVVGADVVTLSPTLVFSDAAIGAGKTVSLTGSTIGGAAASNYTLSLAGAPTALASITTKTLTVGGSFTASNKAYDGTTSASIGSNSLSLIGVVGTDVVTLSPTLVFASATVGAGKTVSLTGSTLGGANAANYTLSLAGAPTTTAAITARTLTVGGSFTALDKTYDNTIGATIDNNSLSLVGVQGADVVSLSAVAVFSDAAAGAGKTVSLTGSSIGGTDASNYTLSLAGAPTALAAINARTLTITGSFTANNKTYDGTTSASINVNSLGLSGVVGGDVVSLSPTLVFSNASVGTGKSVSLTGSAIGGASASNYSLSLAGAPTSTASITGKSLTITGTFGADDKVYDGTTTGSINANSLVLNGVLGGDVVTLTPGLVFADEHVGAGKTVSLTGSTLGGAAASEYTISFAGAPTTTASITVKTLTIGGSFTANDKPFDNTNAATISVNNLTLVGKIASDDVTLSPTVTFADAAAASGKTVSITGGSLSGADATNYTLSLAGSPTSTAAITSKGVTISGSFTANDKIYDGTVAGAINTNSLVLDGIVGGEDVSLVPVLAFEDAAVGGGKVVTLNGSTLGGAHGSEYSISFVGAPTTTASITAKTLTVGGTFTVDDKAYDGTAAATINDNSLTLDGVVGSDDVDLAPAPVFADAAVGAGKQVELTGSTLTGTAATNYILSLSGAPTTTASITATVLTVTGSFTANNKTYDGTTAGSIGVDGLSLSGVVGVDDVTLVPALVFADASVGGSKTVTLTGSTLAGTDAGKYTLSLAGAPTTTAAITPKTLTVGGSFTANDKTYDGTIGATIDGNSLSLTGIVGGDAVTLAPALVFADAAVGANKTVSLTGSTLAGAASSNYTLSLASAPTALASITAQALTIAGSFTANDKTYDGTTGATINGNSLVLSGIIGSDDVVLVPALAFANASAGGGKIVSLTGSTLSGADAAKYTLSMAGAPTTTAAITAKSLTVGGSFTANDKAYDGTTSATIGSNSLTLTGIVNTDDVSVSPTLVFADETVGTNKTVSLTGSTLSGAAASNYALSLAGAPTASAAITSAALTITGSFSANDKTYDGATSATINGNTLVLSGVVGGDVVTLTPTLVFADANVGAVKTVSLAGSTLGGADAGKYTLSLAGAPTATAAITVKTLTVGGSFTASDKGYDGTTVATIGSNSLTLVGVVNTDDVSLSPTPVFDDENVGAGKTVSLAGSSLSGGAASNYTLSLVGAPTALASITSAALTITGSFTANDKTYDGSTSATINGNSLSLSGIVGADDVTLVPTLVFADAVVGTNKTVSLTGSTLGGADAGKYTLSLAGAPTTAAAIGTKTLTVGGGFTANDKAYDGNTTASIGSNSLTLVGVVNSDDVTLSPTPVFADENVGAGKTVSLTGSSLSGGAASNYTLSLAGAPTAMAAITSTVLTITGSFTANDKTYDGATSATISANTLSLSGIVGADDVSLSPTLVFADGNVGANKSVSLTGSVLAGTDAGKYTLSMAGAPTTAAAITAKSLTVVGSFTANDKSYDGTTAATIAVNSLNLSGIVGADDVALSPTVVFDDATVGVGKTVSLAGSSLGGAAASNYTLSLSGAPTASASITAKSLTIAGSFTSNDKTYDGATSATIGSNSLTLSGVVGGDVVTLVPALVFADAAADVGKTVSLTGSALAGADAGRYSLSLVGAPTATAAITPKSLTVGGSFTANNKTYDGTTSATIGTNSLTLTGIVGADVVTIAPILVFADAAVGTGKTVSLTGSGLAGAAASNYTLSLAGAPTTTASITSSALTITGSFTANDKTYDGATSATIDVNSLSLSGVVGGDVVTLVPILVFADAAVGGGKVVGLAGSTLSGADAGKYTLSVAGAPTTTAAITPKTLTVGGSFTALGKAYDGTTSATIDNNSLTLNGVVGADAVTLVPALVFSDAAVGTGKTVSLTGSSLSGADAGNYTLSLAGAPTTTSNITTAAITITGGFSTSSKAYDGNTTATLTGNGLSLVGIGTDDVVLVPVLAFSDPSVGSGKTVNLSGSTITGADAGKYTLSHAGAPTDTASITPKILTVGGGFTANDKGYDGTTGATINSNSLNLIGVVGADAVTLVPALVFSDAAVGTGKTVSLTGSSLSGAAASNYELSLTGAPTATASISSGALTITGSFTANDKTYDGTNAATINGNSLVLNGVAGGDAVTLVPVVVFDNSSAGSGKTVNMTGTTLSGADAGKYTLTLTGAPTATASVAPKSLTVGGSFTANDKFFDNTISATINTNSLTLVGLVGADDVSLVPTPVFADAAIGSGKTVSLTGSSLAGTAASNYTLSLTGAPTATASINSVGLTIGGSFTAVDKTYDGTNAATINTNALTLSGVVGGDAVTLVPVLTFGDSAAGAGKTVTLTGSTLAGADAGKYTLSLAGAPTATASIARKTLTVGGTFTADNKLFDNTTSASINANSLSLAGVVGSDDVSLVPTPVFADAAIGVGKTVSLTGSSLSGAAAANYTLSLAGAPTTTASITALSLTIGGSFTANDKVYDGTNAATINANSLTLNGVAGGDAVTLVPVPTFGDSAAGAGKTVSLTSSTLAGADAGKYTLSLAGAPTATASITAKPITIVPVAGQSKAYGDADTTFAFTNGEWGDNSRFTGGLGRVPGDSLGAYAFTLGSLSAGSNHTLVLDGSAPTFAIVPRPVTITANAQNKLYGTTLVLGTSAFTVTTGSLVSASDITGVSLASAGAVDTASTGTYPIVPSAAVGPGVANYAITYANGTLTVGASPNAAPSFVKGADQTVLEDAGAQAVPNWATAISMGPAFESTQAPTFVLTNSNNALFATQPEISPDGTLTFVPAADANGSATVTVVLRDDGGTAGGGVDSSAAQTFTITVVPVNDAPSFVKGADQGVLQTAGAQNLTGWATSVSNGPADEASQARTFVVANSNNTLFSTQPSIGSDGSLTYELSGLTSGSATVTVVLRDDGGTGNGGVDSSAAQTFVIVVGAVNRAPGFTKGADQVVLEDAGARSVAGWATAISTGPANESSQSASFAITSDNSGLFSVQPAISSTGELTYTPAANANGTAVVTVVMHDNGGTGNGGVDSSAPQTFEIRVTGVNDAPSFVAGADVAVDESSGDYSKAWATSVSKGPADEASQAVSFAVSTDAPNLFAKQPAIDSSGVLSFVPRQYAYGLATISVRMSDDGGVANGGVDTAEARTFRIEIRHVVANIHPPVVTTGGGAATVTDSVMEGVRHVADLDATDADTVPVLRWAIAGGPDASKFAVDSLSGVLAFVAAPDFEAPASSAGSNTYTVVLQVGDGLHVATQTHLVEVQDKFEPTDPPKRLVLSPDTLRLLVGDSGRFAFTVLANTGGVLDVDPSRITWSWSPSPGTQAAGAIKADRIGRAVVKANLGTIVDSALVLVTGLDAVIPPSSTATNHNVGSGITVSVPPRSSPVQIDVEPAPPVAVDGMVVSDKSVRIGARTDSIVLGLSVPLTVSKVPPGRNSSQIEVFKVDSLGGMTRVAPVVAAGDSATFSSKGPGKYVLAWDTTPPVVRMRVAKDSVRVDSLDVWYWLDGNSPDDTTSICTRLAGVKGSACKDVHTGNVDSGLVRIARNSMPHGAEVWISGRDAYNRDATIRKDIVVHHDTLRSPARLPEDRYDLVSMPYFDSTRIPVEEMARVFGEYDIRRWRAYRTTSSGFEEIQGGAKEAIGGAWWVRTRNAKSAPWYGNAWTTPVSKTVEIRLHPGWNAMGNPYGFDVDWNAILDSSKLDSGAINGPYRFLPESQSWSIPDSTRLIEAWHGVVVRNNTGSTLVLRVPSVGWGATAARAMEARRSLRRLEIVASQTDVGSARIAAGIDSLASGGIDRMDHPMPPVPGRVFGAFFPSPDKSDSSTRYLTDVRPETDSGAQWTFKVTGLKARTPVLLRPPTDLEGLADTIWLMDQKSGSVYPWTSPLEFAVGNEIQRTFTMAIGARPAARLAGGFGIVCRRNLVKWSLPPEFARSRVRVNVFDFNGRLISNVVDEEEDPGSYSTSLKNVVRSHAPHVVVLDAGGHRASVVYLPVRGP